MMLYFIRAGDLVKIGVTEDIDRRVAQLQTGNPRRLLVVATVPNATFSIEKIYHSALKRWRVRGEWFSYRPLAGLVAHISNGVRPVDEAGVRHYAGSDMRPRRERTPPPEGFGKIMSEVRRAPERRAEFLELGGLYAQAVAALDKRNKR